MKLKIDSIEYKREKQQNWHRWFAWHPVRINETDVRWLEFVLRKKLFVLELDEIYSYATYKVIDEK